MTIAIVTPRAYYYNSHFVSSLFTEVSQTGCWGRYFLLVQKVTKDTLKGHPAGFGFGRLRRPCSQAGFPLRIPILRESTVRKAGGHVRLLRVELSAAL